MIKGEKIRYDIHEILYSIYKFNKTFNNLEIKKKISKHKEEDVSFINNVALNSMRFNLHVSNIINRYIKKKIRDNEKILLISAITQIVFLDMKEYAVINCSVEIAKKLKIYHGFINAILKKISKHKIELRNNNIKFEDLPLWFRNKTTYLTNNEKDLFLKNFNTEPSLHLVFKNENSLKNFEENLEKTSKISGFLTSRKKVTEIKSFENGEWWVQDFSSFFPLHNIEIKGRKMRFLDTCAAPGGKSFQLLSKHQQIILNDKSKSRIQILKSNLNRLNFKTKILNMDFNKFDEQEKFDFVIIDAPCSAIGTIRKNPEIFFKYKSPNFKELIKVQQNMLNKASNILNKNGFILYMVCSFLKNETKDQINNFLSTRDNFQLKRFDLLDENKRYRKLIDNSFILTLPNTIQNYNIDGYFAAYLKKIK